MRVFSIKFMRDEREKVRIGPKWRSQPKETIDQLRIVIGVDAPAQVLTLVRYQETCDRPHEHLMVARMLRELAEGLEIHGKETQALDQQSR